MKLPLIAACLVAGSTWSFANADVTTSTQNQKTAPRPYTQAQTTSVRGPAVVKTDAQAQRPTRATKAEKSQENNQTLQKELANKAEVRAQAQAQALRRKQAAQQAAQQGPASVGSGSRGTGGTAPQQMVTLAPTNDDCSTPTAIVGTGTFAFDNTGATTGIDGQTEGLCTFYGSTVVNYDIWYTWVAPSTGIATWTFCGLGTIDTKVAAYAGVGCPAPGTALACDDDFCGFPYQSQIQFAVTSGSSYTLQLGNYPFGGGNPGAGSFSLNVSAPASNDDCSTPTVVVGTGSFPFDNTVASTGVDGQTEGACFIFSNTAVANDVWFQWTAPFTGIAQYDTCGSGIDTKIAAYAGAGCPAPGTALGCSDDICGLQSSIQFAVTSGATYTLQLGTYPWGPAPGGVGSFNLFQYVPIPLDDCSLPSVIAGVGSFPFDTTGMTTSGQQGACGGTAGQDMWFQWTAPTTGTCQLDTCGSSYDTYVKAYSGAGCPAGAALTCNDDNVCGGFFTLQSMILFPVTAGNVYMLQIGGFGGNSGPGVLNLAVLLPPANDDCTTPTSVVGYGSFPFDNTVASTGTDGQSEGNCLFFSNTAVTFDVWYTWTAPVSEQVSFDTCGSGVDTKIAIYGGTGCPTAGSSIACNDDACGLQSRILFNAVAGTTYTLQIGTWPWGAQGGAGNFQLIPAAPPPNDDCSSPTVIAGTGSFPYDLTFASTGVDGQSEALCNFYGSTNITFDAWWTWTAPASGCTIIDNCGQTLDGKMSVYAGAGCPTPGTSIACSDDTCGLQSQVRFTATAGSTYTIQLGTWPFGAQGDAGFMNIAQIPSGLGNDECSASTVVVGTGVFPYDNSVAGTGCEGQDSNCGTIFNDIWFTWTAPATGYATYSTCGGLTTQDTILAAYPAGGCPTPGSSLACNDDACGVGGGSTAFWFVTAGTTYSLQLGDWGGTPGGTGFFSLDVMPPPGPCDPWDDGFSDNGIGFTLGGDLVWMSKFGNPGVTTTINSVDVAWGSGPWPSAGVPNGDPSDVFIWQDGISQDGDPSDATLLLTIPTTIQNVDTDIMNNIVLGTPLTVTGLFFVGTHCQHPPVDFSTFPPTGFPLPLDQSVHIFPDVSWLCGNLPAGQVSDYSVLTNNVQPPVSMDAIGFPGQHLLRVNCSFGPATYTCTPGDPGINTCPCSNPPTGANRGCNNKDGTGGASITGSGTASVASSSLTFTTAGENATVGSVLIQGSAFNAGINFGHGVRCTAGQIKRLYIKIASGGSITAPGGGDPSIPVKSASLGSVINPGDTRYYSVYYRDTTVLLPGCPVPANQFNVTNTAVVVWTP
jgi:hypothetical protein